MIARVPALLALCLGASASAADLEGTATVQAQTRARSWLPGDVGSGATTDFALLPVAQARLVTGMVVTDLSYRPTLVFRDLPGNGPFLPLHQGRATVQVHVKQTFVQADAEAAMGIVDLGPLYTTDGSVPAGQVSATATSGVVPYVRSYNSLSIEQQLSRTVFLRGEGNYQVSGSDKNPQLPLQWGPGGLLQLRWEASLADRFSTLAQVRHADFLTGHRQTVGQLSQLWGTHITAQLVTELTAGVAVIDQHLPVLLAAPEVNAFDVEPVVNGNLKLDLPTRGSKLGFEARLGIGPYADRFAATVYERLEGKAGLAWVYERDLAVGLAVSAARSFPRASIPTPPDLLLAFETSLAWSITDWVTTSASFAAAHVEVLVPHSSSLNQWLATVSVTVHGRASTGR